MAGETLIQALDDLDRQMLQNFNAYASFLNDTWENFYGNNGQLAITHRHIREVVSSHISDAKDQWPYGANPDNYLSEVYACFDSEVIERAFGDTLEGSYGTIMEYWLEAMDWQLEHEFIVTVTGGGPMDPHSTESNWGNRPATGGGGDDWSGQNGDGGPWYEDEPGGGWA